MAYVGSEFFEEGYLEMLGSVADVGEYEALGRLVKLWHVSQRRRKHVASPSEVSVWSGYKAITTTWIDGLVACELLVPLENGSYEIVGNAKRITACDRKSEGGKIGNALRWGVSDKRSGSDRVAIAPPSDKRSGSDRVAIGMRSPPGIGKRSNDNDNDNEERISIVARPRATPPIEDITGGTSGDMTPRPQDDTPCATDAPEESPQQGGNQPAPTPEAKRAALRYTDADRLLASDWASWASTRSKTVRPDIARWADTFRRMREIDGLTDPDLRAMFDFVRSDDFWAKNAISPAHLRARSKNGLLKHENLRNSMTPPEDASRSIYDAIDLPEF